MRLAGHKPVRAVSGRSRTGTECGATVWSCCPRTNSIGITSSLCADLIFGMDGGPGIGEPGDLAQMLLNGPEIAIEEPVIAGDFVQSETRLRMARPAGNLVGINHV